MNRLLGRYQLLYGVLGLGLNTYYLLTAGTRGAHTVQVYLVILAMLGFSVGVLLAGLAQFRQWPGWPVLVLPLQLVQLADLQLGDLFLRLRCGFAVNVHYLDGVVTWTMDPTDVASQLVWRMPAPATEGFNIFALLVSTLVLVSLFDRRKNQI
ncbi:hypothetical protein [Hymenobacter properus]|uniref:Uncharacterized protein n=1 Tax=Hymenobacter properus TaxID=2791026 RepID=A0A931BIQ1_9BACT|nr:hypothetical protein [Hymenobacter properus]MBF9143241.1 hypothetical protein [Hymenobacter properus]MBR7722051.1 hypothetical protein [Microvirga sp. SRT04]